MKVSTVLDQIDIGSIALPEFQRGYVWNREQVRGLMYSLYRKFPVGILLVWVTKSEGASARGDAALQPGVVKLLLDGQQRITTLYGIIRGRAPKFFYGNEKAFTGLYFNLEDEIFEFYAPAKMKGNPMWFNVNDLMNKGIGHSISELHKNPNCTAELDKYIGRLTNLYNIKDVDFHVEEVTGEDRTIDVVVDIFNKVNSGGTKLSKGDLALAKVCAEWPNARHEMRALLEKWEKAGFYFKLEWLLRVVNSIMTGKAFFSALNDVDTDNFQKNLKLAEKTVNYLLNLISARLGLDHDRVLGSRYSFPILARYAVQKGKYSLDTKESDKLLYWYIHTFLWGRYAGSTETILSQDLSIIEEKEGALDRLIDQLHQIRGDLRVHPDNFKGWSIGARFYPLLYMLARVWKARDWGSGIELSQSLLGKQSSLQLHHIFPKSKLYEHDYLIDEVNALANFTFLTQETNLKVSNRDPEIYLEEFFNKHPGALESHWIPMDRELWKYDRYRDFLEARREILSKAANDFLESLLAGSIPEVIDIATVLERELVAIPGGIESEEEERKIHDCNEWVRQQGLPKGEHSYELTDETTGEAIAVLDLAWPNGLQEGLSKPVALLINESQEIYNAANQAGFIYFTDVDSFHKYVLDEVLVIEKQESSIK